MATLTQRSFSGGEISPSLYARVDFSKYQVGLRQCRNFIVQKHGGVANRPGTEYVFETKIQDSKVRLVPFIFSRSQTYVLEFGHQYVRFVKDGNLLTEAAKVITLVTSGVQTTVTSAAHGYINGQEVYIDAVLGIPEIEGRSFIVSDVAANTFKLKLKSGLYAASTGTYVSGGTVAKIYEITTTYAAADLMDLQFTQSADIVTIVNGKYAPAELKRFSDVSWTLANISFKSDVGFPFSLATPASTGTTRREYKVTAIRKDDYKESNVATTGTFNITAITNANPARVTLSAAYDIIDGDEVYLQISGMPEVNERRFFVTNVVGASFDLIGENSTGYGSFISGFLYPCFVRFSRDAITAAAPVAISWSYSDTVTQAQEFNIYRRDSLSGSFGLVGVVKGKTFSDVGITPDTKATPPSERNPFLRQPDYPNVIAYFQQRLFLGNTASDTEKIYSSKIGEFKNFGVSSPIQDDDALTFKISSRQVSTIRHLLDLGQLVVFSQGGEHIVGAGSNDALTPANINVKQQSYNGASKLSPLVVNDTALYVQERGSVVRDIAFRFESDGYTGDDLTIFAFHLFEGFEIIDWTYAQVPHSTVWAVRSDGVLLGLTYLKEQRIVAWHRHDFAGGLVENVCTVPDSDEDSLHVVVNRSGVRSVERLTTRQVFDIKDVRYMDSSMSVDGRNIGLTTMTLTGGVSWTYNEELTLTASAAFFSASSVGNLIILDGPLRLEVISFTSATVVKVRAHKTVPVNFRAVATRLWSKAVNQVRGLWHLEGKQVSVLGDGFVESSPNNASYGTLTVANGAVTLSKPYSVIHVGLPYISDLETLNIDTPQGESISDKKMLVSSVNIFVEKSRGGFVGPTPPNDGLLQGLFEFKIRNDEDYDSPVSLRTGTMESAIDSQFNDNGRIFLRQVDPLPMTVLSIQPAGVFPFRG